ncbi:MAG: hypothetical protein U9R28_07670 [Pseudomonadota bacterium]|nr:hypothetical protein [Pseudomonadota bacterium]
MVIGRQFFLFALGLVGSSAVYAQAFDKSSFLLAEANVQCMTVQCISAQSATEKRPVAPQKKKPASTESQFDVDNNCVTVTGTASSENVDEAFARQMAIRNGLNFATLNNNVTISSDHSIENFQLTRDATRFTSSSKVESYKILKEGFEEAFDAYGEEKTRPLNYQVKMEVCLTENPKVCENLSGNYYQPRLVVAPLAVAKNYQTRDISNLIAGYQTELNRRLVGSGYRNITVLNQSPAIDEQVGIYPNTSKQVLEPIRDKTGAQYMLMSVLRSASSHVEGGKYLNPVKHFYNLPVEKDARYLEVDWYLVDLMKNTVIHQQRKGFDIKGDVRVGRDRPFGSNAFFATDTGMAFHALLTEQVRDVGKALKCKELNTQIIDVRGDDYVIYLNADSGAKVGDELAVYQRIGRSVQFQGIDLGSDEVPTAFIKIKRILPRFAVAELVAKKGVIQLGDTVKAW